MYNASRISTDLSRKGGWLPVSQDALEKWLRTSLDEVARRKLRRAPLLPVIERFKEFIEDNSEIFMEFHQMFEGSKSPYPTDYEQLLRLFDLIIQTSPTFGEIGPPIYMAISRVMNTQGGFTAFLSAELNKHFKEMFDVWADFLSSEASRYVLNANKGGWLSNEAIRAMDEHFDNTFANIFECDPNAPYFGFYSWDDFFTRTFRPGVRAVELPDEPDIINAACESTLYNIARDIKAVDQFWIKGEPYSLMHMLNNDPDYAEQFIGGSVFQGFLNINDYHRWHTPVTGTIKKVVRVPGTYFAQSPALIGEDNNPYLRSLSFITAITTRALIFIESINPKIGLMCFIAIGMTEVSTCEVTVQENQWVKRGDQLGMFHFGGSSHALVFRAGTNINFDKMYSKPGDHIKVRAAIAAADWKRRSDN